MTHKNYTVEEAARKIKKSPQTVRAYVKKGLLSLAPDSNVQFLITGESIDALPSKLAGAMNELRHTRSQNMKEKWRLINAAA